MDAFDFKMSSQSSATNKRSEEISIAAEQPPKKKTGGMQKISAAPKVLEFAQNDSRKEIKQHFNDSKASKRDCYFFDYLWRTND